MTWLNALERAGIDVLPEADEIDEMVKNAKSIFEFEAKDIDGMNIDLNRYRQVNFSAAMVIRSYLFPLFCLFVLQRSCDSYRQCGISMRSGPEELHSIGGVTQHLR